MRIAFHKAAKVLGMKRRPRRDDESIPDDILTVAEAARRYGIHENTARQRFDSNEWPGRRADDGAGPRLFRASTLDEIEAKKNGHSE